VIGAHRSADECVLGDSGEDRGRVVRGRQRGVAVDNNHGAAIVAS
jgi:hypothetical protein